MPHGLPRITLPPVTLRQAEHLVGLPYVAGEFDCAHLAVMAQEYFWGRTVRLPLKNHPRSPRRQAETISALRVSLADELMEAETGCVVLFIGEGPRGDPQWHIGTCFVEGGETWVLHVGEGTGSSVLQRLADCQRSGLHVEGFYKWR